MRILYCIPNLRHGGAERQLTYIAAELAKMGHEVHVASSLGGANLERIKAGRVEWHRLGGFSNHDPIIFFRLVALIRKLQPDVIQTILTPMDLMGGVAALLTRTRWVLRESSSSPLYTSGFRYKLRSLLGRWADAVVSNSAGGDAYWSSAGARVRHIIPNSVPVDEIDEGGGGGGRRPDEESPLKPAFKTVIFAGRMDAGKNVETLITALAKIADEIPFIALLCGDGPRRVELERMAGAFGLGQRILFPGYVSNLWSLMKRADALVSLSRFEGCPNVVLEAAACGAPLVVSDIPAHRELLNESCALFVHPNDSDGVATALREVLTCEGAAKERARAARDKVGGMLVDEPARRYEQIYRSFVRGK